MSLNKVNQIRGICNKIADQMNGSEHMLSCVHLTAGQIAEAVILWKSLNRSDKYGFKETINYLNGELEKGETHEKSV